jgi:hypothetical protein
VTPQTTRPVVVDIKSFASDLVNQIRSKTTIPDVRLSRFAANVIQIDCRPLHAAAVLRAADRLLDIQAQTAATAARS